LANKPVLPFSGVVAGTDPRLNAANGANYLIQQTLNWARTPTSNSLDVAQVIKALTQDFDINITRAGVNRDSNPSAVLETPQIPVTRYGLNAVVVYDMSTSLSMHFQVRA
jgi:hypothetical protein